MNCRWKRPFIAAILGVLALLGTSFGATAGDGDDAAHGTPSGAGHGDDWLLAVPGDQQVVFHGVANFDGAGAGNSQIMYPAPNLGGFLAAVLTHGALVDSTRRTQREKLQEGADKVLAPYAPLLATFTYGELKRRTQARERTDDGPRPFASAVTDGVRVAIGKPPVFSMTQDQRAIILDASVTVRPPGLESTLPLDHVVRVVSVPIDLDSVPTFWTTNDGNELKELSATLLLESLNLAIVDAKKAEADFPYRTVRYLEGGTEKIERAQVIGGNCSRMVLRNLRGGLMSVPVARNIPNPGVAGCSPG